MDSQHDEPALGIGSTHEGSHSSVVNICWCSFIQYNGMRLATGVPEHVWPSTQVQNAVGEVESEDAYILVESVDIFGMIERHLETKRMTLKSLFMQFLRSQVSF